MKADSSAVLVPFERLQQFITRALTLSGLPVNDAEQVATLMAQADMQGSDGHGVIRLAPYIKRIESGGMNTKPNIQLAVDSQALGIVDGDNGMGHLVVSYAVKVAIEKAKQYGVAWVGTRNSNHAGPASLYARMPLAHGMIGLYFAVGNANHMPPWGGMDMLLSTNPIAAAIPANNEPDIVLDMATTVAAYGKVKAKAKRGEMMPEGWMIDREGKSLLDPARAEEGFLLPIGGHKGYGLALIVGLLAGTLNGAAMGKEVIDFNKDFETTTNTGQSILVINVNATGRADAFKDSVDQLEQDIRNSTRLPNCDRIWLPGEQSHMRREQSAQQGIPLPTPLLNELAQLAQRLGIESLT
jgi:L-2-hydroxycarboxylate dehydrogenase (NAD+)